MLIIHTLRHNIDCLCGVSITLPIWSFTESAQPPWESTTAIDSALGVVSVLRDTCSEVLASSKPGDLMFCAVLVRLWFDELSTATTIDSELLTVATVGKLSTLTTESFCWIEEVGATWEEDTPVIVQLLLLDVHVVVTFVVACWSFPFTLARTFLALETDFTRRSILLSTAVDVVTTVLEVSHDEVTTVSRLRALLIVVEFLRAFLEVHVVRDFSDDWLFLWALLAQGFGLSFTALGFDLYLGFGCFVVEAFGRKKSSFRFKTFL